MNPIAIRIASVNDAASLLNIYAYYVENTAITFEYQVPSIQEFANRIYHILQTYPYLVATIHNEIVGYAYASPFKDRDAYNWAVETTIYIKEGMKKKGIGRKLYESLEAILYIQNILNLNACIAYPAEEEDEYLTKDSAAFHEHFGYKLVGEFHQCGYKFNRWYNMVWMEKHIGIHLKEQPLIKPFGEIKKMIYNDYGIK